MESKEEKKKEDELTDHSSQDLSQEDSQEAENQEAEDQGAEEAEAELTPEEQLQKQMDELTAQVDDQKDKYLRLAAEFDNYRKRTMKEKAELILNGSEKSITSFLPVIDDLERASKMSEKAEDVVAIREGIELIRNKFISILSQYGVKIIETADKPLDTDLHEAVAVIPAPKEEQKGKIIDTVLTGYTMNDKVIRHSKVVVGE